jgi:ABC-type uncharacterized transport system substrate-binding protein
MNVCGKRVAGVLLGMFLIAGNIWGQAPAWYGQQIGIAKKLRPDLKVIGVMGKELTDKAIESATRAGMGQGVTVVIVRPKSPTEIASLYKRLVSEKKAQMVLLPDPEDDLMTGLGFEYLREATLGDGVGLMVPKAEMVDGGGLCAVLTEGGNLKTLINHKVAGALGISIPADLAAK